MKLKPNTRWNHVVFHDFERVPVMRRGPKGQYDSGETKDWVLHFECDCGHKWHIEESRLQNQNPRKLWPRTCGRPECKYHQRNPVSPREYQEGKVSFLLHVPFSLYRDIEKHLGEYGNNRTQTVLALIRKGLKS